MSNPLLETTIFLLVIINPFLLSVYLMDLIRGLSPEVFRKVLLRAMLISYVAYLIFAWGGDAIFSKVLHVQFASFQVFGGLVFVVVAIRYMVFGAQAIIELRGSPEHMAGSIAMPFMIGPATVSACVLIGAQSPLPWAAAAIAATLILTTITILILKTVHDRVRQRRSELIERYAEIMGRVSAVLIGTIAVEMVFRGLSAWLANGRGGN